MAPKKFSPLILKLALQARGPAPDVPAAPALDIEPLTVRLDQIAEVLGIMSRQPRTVAS